MTRFHHDVVIVGGGPAGLGAALVLGRCLRRVLLIDAAQPRNAAALSVNGFPGHEGKPPPQLLAEFREQLRPYRTVELRRGMVSSLEKTPTGFLVNWNGPEPIATRSVILATGVKDHLPPVPGAAALYGVTLHHCPLCEAYEHRGQQIGVIGNDKAAAELAIELMLWSREITLFTHDASPMAEVLSQRLQRAQIRIVPGHIKNLEAEGKRLRHVLMEDGTRHARDVLFYMSRQIHQSQLAAALGCAVDPESQAIQCSPDGSTEIPGLYAAGNLTGGMQMAVVAAAEGVRAAAALNDWMIGSSAWEAPSGM